MVWLATSQALGRLQGRRAAARDILEMGMRLRESAELEKRLLALKSDLHYRERFPFPGDHLDWDRDTRQLGASKDYCWYSWWDQASGFNNSLIWHIALGRHYT
jgi:hypothetical protein